jgi:hypothetical protein
MISVNPFDDGRPEDKIIIGNHPRRFLLGHTGDGRISITTPGGEVGWFDADELAAMIGAYYSERL